MQNDRHPTMSSSVSVILHNREMRALPSNPASRKAVRDFILHALLLPSAMVFWWLYAVVLPHGGMALFSSLFTLWAIARTVILLYTFHQLYVRSQVLLATDLFVDHLIQKDEGFTEFWLNNQVDWMVKPENVRKFLT